jgi:hypothetical protein
MLGPGKQRLCAKRAQEKEKERTKYGMSVWVNFTSLSLIQFCKGRNMSQLWEF